MKKISGKRSKTEADHEELARLEFQGSLYMGDDGPVLPAHVLEAAIIAGAKKSKDGPRAKTGVFVSNNARLEYDGPRDREGLWADDDFRLVAPVVISRSRIMRTRPLFKDWSAKVEIIFQPDICDKQDVVKWCEAAGYLVGLCDWRPRYGRFEVQNGQGPK